MGVGVDGCMCKWVWVYMSVCVADMLCGWVGGGTMLSVLATTRQENPNEEMFKENNAATYPFSTLQ